MLGLTRTLTPLVLALLLSGCLGGSGADPLDGTGGDAGGPDADGVEVREEKTTVHSVGVPDPVLGTGGVGLALGAWEEVVDVPEGTVRLVVELAWDDDLASFWINVQEQEEVEAPVGLRSKPTYSARDDDGDGHVRLVVEDPPAGAWELASFAEGAAYDVDLTLRYAVLADDRDVALF